MEIMLIQMIVIAVCAVILVVGLVLRSKGVNLANVVEEVKTTLNPTYTLQTAAERKEKAKNREDRRRIGWAQRRLVLYYRSCHYGTKLKAFRHLTKMAKGSNQVNANLALAVLEQLSNGQGDPKFYIKAVAGEFTMPGTKEAKYKFSQMSRGLCCDIVVQIFANNIRQLVKTRQTTWAELGFTDEDLIELIRLTKVRIAKSDFSKMLDTCYSDQVVLIFANNIRQLVKTGQATWTELGFTDSEVGQKLDTSLGQR